MTACLLACSAAGFKTQDNVGRGDDLEGLVRFGNYVQTLDEWELERQHQRLRASYEASPSSDTAIRLALLLSRPGAPRGALADALTLLTDARDSRQGSQAEFGWVLYHQISARYVAAADSTSLAQRLGEEQARGARLDAELADARTTLDAAERQRIALTEQLDSLKAIEERINRDATVRGQ